MTAKTGMTGIRAVTVTAHASEGRGSDGCNGGVGGRGDDGGNGGGNGGDGGDGGGQPAVRDCVILLFENFETLDVMGPAEVFGRLPQYYRLRFVSAAGGVVHSTQRVPVLTERWDDVFAAQAASAAAHVPEPADSPLPLPLQEQADAESTPVSDFASVPAAASASVCAFASTSASVSASTSASTAVSAAAVLLVPGGAGTRTLVDDEALLQALAAAAPAVAYVLSVCTGAALLAKAGLLDGIAATTNKIAFDWVVALRPQVDWRRRARWVRSGVYYTSSGISAGIDMALAFVADRHGLECAESVAWRMEYLWNRDSDEDPFGG